MDRRSLLSGYLIGSFCAALLIAAGLVVGQRAGWLDRIERRVRAVEFPGLSFVRDTSRAIMRETGRELGTRSEVRDITRNIGDAIIGQREMVNGSLEQHRDRVGALNRDASNGATR